MQICDMLVLSANCLWSGEGLTWKGMILCYSVAGCPQIFPCYQGRKWRLINKCRTVIVNLAIFSCLWRRDAWRIRAIWRLSTLRIRIFRIWGWGKYPYREYRCRPEDAIVRLQSAGSDFGRTGILLQCNRWGSWAWFDLNRETSSANILSIVNFLRSIEFAPGISWWSISIVLLFIGVTISLFVRTGKT